MHSNIEEREEVQKEETTEEEASEVEEKEKLEEEEELPEEEAAALIREDIESALRLLRPPAVPWRVRIRFNTDGSIDLDIGSADLVRGVCLICPPCCRDPWG